MNVRIRELIDRSMYVSSKDSSFDIDEFARELAYSVVQECCDIIEESSSEDSQYCITMIEDTLCFDNEDDDYEAD